jgi:hypothetical protein
MRIAIVCFSLLVVSATSQAQITWNGASTTVAPNGSGYSHPRIAVNRAGNPMVLWGHGTRVMFTRWDGTKFSTPLMLNPTSRPMASASWMGPDMAAHGDTVYVVMKEVPEAQDTCLLWCAHSYDGGKTFSAPVKVDTEPSIITRFPAITTDDAGNPIIAFMKFGVNFGGARWAVLRSTDCGKNFSTDVKASGWSGPTSTVCDCCPGQIVSSGNTVVMAYRDNDTNIRDSWVGVSDDGGRSFTRGWNADQLLWHIESCPASGPSVMIYGDSLYLTFMSTATGKTLVYRSVSALSGSGSVTTVPLTTGVSGLDQENYPRLSHSGKAAAIVWAQTVSGATRGMLSFTDDITNGFPAAQAIATSNVVCADVAMYNGKVFVVLEDDNSGVMRFRSGTYPTGGSSVTEPVAMPALQVYPNPAGEGTVRVTVGNMQAATVRVLLFTISGDLVGVDDATVTSGAFITSLRALPQGAYVMRVIGGTSTAGAVVVRR